MKHNNNTSKKVPEPAKVFDVRRPGKTSVSATSRPVIVGHKPQVHDPMVSRDTERPALMDSAQKVTVQPATAPIVPDTPHAVVTSGPPSEPAASVTPAETPGASVTTVTPSVPRVADGVTLPERTESTTIEPDPDPEAAADLAVVALKDVASVDTNTVPTANAPVVSAVNEVSGVSTVPAVTTQPVAPAPKADDGYFEFPAEESSQPAQYSEKPLPDLPQEPTQPSEPQIYVSHHPHQSAGTTIWICLVLLIVVVVVIDIMLDAGFIVADKIPHTTFFR